MHERRHRPPHRRAALLVICAGTLIWVSPALAAPVPGASYAGTAASGGTIRFTVAPDGKDVTSYRIDGVTGDTCQFIAQGDAGVWPGAPIRSNAFRYDLDGAFVLSGTFPGAQTATGVFRFSNAAVPGVKPACESGVIAWSATTTTATTQPAGQAAPPGTGTSSSARRMYRTTFLLRRPGRARLIGRLKSLGRGCAGRRRVVLKRGLRTVATVTTKADGTFSFKRTRSMRGVRVRFSVTRRQRPLHVCAAATSKTLALPKR